jgi:hypothetical protein
MLPELYPLPAWETVKPGDVFRVFERGGRNITNLFPETGLPNALGQLQRLEEPGRPDFRQSNRGPGTGARIAVPLINITKTRLNDPHTWFSAPTTSRATTAHSGCASCHVVYANDRDPRHSGPLRRSMGTSGKSRPSTRPFPRTAPATRCSTPSPGRSPPASACLPHAPAQHVREQLPRLHHVGLRVRCPAHVAGAAESTPPREHTRGARPQSRGGGAAGQVGRRRLPEEGSRAQPAAVGHPVRRLPRPRLELPRRVQARPQGQPARRRGQSSWPTTIRTSSTRPCTCRPSTWTSRHALRRLPLLPGCNHGNGHIYGEVARRSRSTARTATARPRPTPTCSPRARPPSRAAPISAPSATPDGRLRFEWDGGKL